MTRPAPTVTVPVEPTEAMRPIPDRVVTEALYWMARAYERVHSMPRVSDTELANKIEAAKADLGRARDASPILSAPAAPQAAGVGEREEIAREVHKGRFPSDREATPFDQESKEAQAYCYRITDRILSALRAPSREPEGGAADDDRQPSELEIAIRELLWPYFESAKLGHFTHENDCSRAARQIAGSLKPGFYLSRFLPALATREEAPAEALRWAELLIEKLPSDHEGRNSWLMNYGGRSPRVSEAERQPPIDSTASTRLEKHKPSEEETKVILNSKIGPVDIDASIAHIVQALWGCGIETVASCSGHTHRPGNIALKDGRELIIARNYDEARKIDALFPLNICGEEVPTEAGEELQCTFCGDPCECGWLDAEQVARAQPQAREDAQPYGWIYERFDVGPGWCAPNEWHPAQFTRTPPKPETSRNVIALYAEAQPQAREDAQPVAKIVSAHGDPEAFGERELVVLQDLSRIPYNTPLYARPAPDALRVAVEALEPFAAVMADIGESEDDADSFRNPRRDYARSQGISVGHIRRAAQALAALQAEQKGGAA